MIKYLEKENLDELLSDGITLVDFYADWCGPCKMQGEVLKDFQTLDVLKVDVDKYPNIAKAYGIMSIPTIMLFENGNVLRSNVGFMNIGDLENFVK